MTCKHCHTELLDAAVYCHACGRKQQPTPRPRRHHHRAKAQGTITKLSGNRKNPYWARGPAEYKDGKVLRPSIGCYPTYAAASESLGKAMYGPKPPVADTTTLQDMYDRFVAVAVVLAVTFLRSIPLKMLCGSMVRKTTAQTEQKSFPPNCRIGAADCFAGKSAGY